MILGIGTDIVEIKRIEALSKRQGFEEKLYTAGELEYARECGHYHSALAARFAAKEAVVKALGHGFGGWPPQDVEVGKRALGLPYIILHGEAKAFAEKLGVSHLHVSLSHSEQYATAVVVAEAQD